VRWIISHIGRYKWLALITFLLSIVTNLTYSQSFAQLGRAAQEIITPSGPNGLAIVSLTILGILAVSGLTDLGQALLIEIIAKRFQANAREELYASLLGKSQTFHDRQRVGDIMARATDDSQQLSDMISPGLFFLYGTVLGIASPFLFIALIRLDLLILPSIFLIGYAITLRSYLRRLEPVVAEQREQFGKMNAGLEETISGIEVVKASAQEGFERKKFRDNARRYRDLFVRQGQIEAGYVPPLLLAITIGLCFLHAILLYNQGLLTLPQIVGYMSLLTVLRWPVFSTIFSFSLVQLGIAGANRILAIIKAETELDENMSGHVGVVKGEIEFKNVSFGYEGNPLLNNVSFHIQPGQTIAIVGQTGSGKSTLTQLVNRTYDVTHGQVIIDGIDVREWNLDSLRSQISKIEQDIFLFSRSIAENIAFGAPESTQAQIEEAAKEAQAHDFIMSFKEGYKTVVGERGVTLSGGQRQRIALARAFLSNPRILILDDSTSAIDSATEDEIQKAIQRAQQGRTTLLITHRLSQIRWAAHILVLDHGELVASGSHDELLRRSPVYRRIFARYDVELPPLEAEKETSWAS
jgi:ATP-binding cassette subfamily B protein